MVSWVLLIRERSMSLVQFTIYLIRKFWHSLPISYWSQTNFPIIVISRKVYFKNNCTQSIIHLEILWFGSQLSLEKFYLKYKVTTIKVVEIPSFVNKTPLLYWKKYSDIIC